MENHSQKYLLYLFVLKTNKKTNKANNQFILPLNTIIQPHEFLVICSDLKSFKRTYNNINPLGELGFGLNSDGENLQLYNEDPAQ